MADTRSGAFVQGFVKEDNVKTLKLIAGAAGLMLATWSGSASAVDENILMSFQSLQTPVPAFERDLALQEAKRLGFNLIVTDGQNSSPKQSSDIRNAIVQRIDGAIVLPNDVNAVTAAIDEMLAADIPVVTLDRRVENPSKPVPHSGTDNVAGGRAISDYIIKNFPSGAKIVLLTGQPGSSPAIDRAKGIKDRLAEAGDSYKIVAEQTANWMRSEALTVTQSILTGLNEPVDVIIGSSDEMALGAVEALQTAPDIMREAVVIGFDATPEGLARVRSGELLATVDQANGVQTKNAIEMLLAKIRDGKKMADINTSPFIVDKSNLEKAERIGEVSN